MIMSTITYRSLSHGMGISVSPSIKWRHGRPSVRKLLLRQGWNVLHFSCMPQMNDTTRTEVGHIPPGNIIKTTLSSEGQWDKMATYVGDVLRLKKK